MKRILIGREDLFGPWMMNRLNSQWFPGRGSIIGLWEDAVGPIAGCLYESCNGRSIIGHLTGINRKWMNREFLWYCFHYPFEELGVDKILGIVESDNFDAQKLDEHLGFTLEATLKNAAPRGDLLIYSMTKNQCKWLNLRNCYRGETKPS